MVSAPAPMALVLVDLQVGLCAVPAGGDPPPLAAEVARRGVLRAAASALETARARSLTVVHVRLAFDERYANRTNRTPRFEDHESAGRFVRGSAATAFCDEVEPVTGELILEKGSVGPFASTPLATVLRARGVGTFAVAGVATHLAIESAAREAADLGFGVVVLEDACAAPAPSLHEHAMGQTIPLFADVIVTAELDGRLAG